ncbi:Glycerol-3-phosphate ABC transporter, ATP-binding protein UgpC (TC 3.A.1.1.3) [hydrothermal vent metagenome]|uniref:Glycerol-3-phosphate ABC transporter, ATP-binding protein UgpC (TC 3.A.1.1.3) n=1 Tax=hydrothermal vent metagenome TaxID=652676 RepID=A0A3B0THY9_9ZZZZ
MAEVILRDVRKDYGGMEVIHGVDVKIDDGDFVVIVGPSGCGKSTLLRMVAGLEPITSGEVLIDGAIVNKIEPMNRDIAMVFQNYALYPHMSVLQNMAFGLRLRRLSKQEVQLRIEKAAQILQLDGLLDRKPSTLSGGQRQRVAMGRAIVRNPKVFLFDEPLSNLDAKLRIQMRLEIKRLHRELSATSIFVTHDQVEAMTMGDKMIVLNDGYVDQVGTPMEVYQKPATVFVAGFIGSPPMTFVEASIGADRKAITDEGHVVAENVDNKIPEGPVIFGIRPEDIELCDKTETGAIPLQVLTTESLGAETLIYCSTGSTELTLRRAGLIEYSLNEKIGVKFPLKSVHFFDPRSQKRYNLSSQSVPKM